MTTLLCRDHKLADATDGELAIMYQGGDERAIEVLLVRYEPLIMGMSRRFWAARGDFLVHSGYEDLAQEARIYFCRAAKAFKMDALHPNLERKRSAGFAGWAQLCVTNRLINITRRQVPPWLPLVSINTDGDAADRDPVDANADVERQVELQAVLDGIFSELEARDIESVQMVSEGHTFVETGAALGRTSVAVSLSMRRARAAGKAYGR